ncbi:MAG: hypothetical protein LUK37_24545, partial [Clostridia bacterium]|nr:hypothetical protein [Clostridia bacterium]
HLLLKLPFFYVSAAPPPFYFTGFLGENSVIFSSICFWHDICYYSLVVVNIPISLPEASQTALDIQTE